MKLPLPILLKLSISAGLLWFAYNSIDVTKIRSIIIHTDFLLLVCAFVVKFSSLIIQAFRWGLIMRQLGIFISFSLAWKNILVGFFFNQALPSSAGGDVVRAWELRHLGIQKIVISIVLDRMFGLFALFLSSVMCAVILLNSIHTSELMSKSLGILIALNFLGILVISISAIFDKIVKCVGFEWIIKKLELSSFFEAIRALVQSKYKITFILLSSVLMHSILALSGYLILLSLGSHSPFLHFFPYFLLALTISTIPLSIGGWGVRETAIMSLFHYIGVATEISLVFSVLYGLLMICVGLPGGLIWLFETKKA